MNGIEEKYLNKDLKNSGKKKKNWEENKILGNHTMILKIDFNIKINCKTNIKKLC
jgi:hypothetical protein